MINLFSVSLVLGGSIVTAFGALFIKRGMEQFSLRTIFKNQVLFSGILLYGISVIIYIIALRREELSVLFPLVSTTYIWSSLLATKFLKEKMNIWKWLSVMGIIIGALFTISSNARE